MTAKIIFICWGNICRSPMAKVVADLHAEKEGLSGVEFTSAGISAEEAGHGMDPRAVATLTAAGYRPGPHTAHKVSAAEITGSDLVIGMERVHLSAVKRLVPGADHLYLLSDFNPNALPGSEIADPWYGDDSDFVTCLQQIEAGIPEVIKRAKELS